MRKATFRTAKGGLLDDERRPLRTQKAVFYKSAVSRALCGLLSAGEQFLFGQQVVVGHAWCGHVSHAHHVLAAARVFVVKPLPVVKLFILLQAAFCAEKVLALRAVACLDEENAARYGVVVVVQAGVNAAQVGRPLVHWQLQADAEQGELRRPVFVEHDVHVAKAVH